MSLSEPRRAESMLNPPSKKATLARVRDNQRRSRARKQKYIADLEYKLRNYEAGESPIDVGFQNTVMRLEQENKRLKSLLKAAGLPQMWADAYLKLTDDADTIDYSPPSANLLAATAISLTDKIADDIEETSPINGNLFDASSNSVTGDFDLFNWTDLPLPFDFPEPFAGIVGTSRNTSIPVMPLDSEPIRESFASTFRAGDCNCSKTSQTSASTTLCAEAYKMVRQYNSKGIDMVEINIRLWIGFRKAGTSDDGCTVDNKVLFSLLDYISS